MKFLPFFLAPFVLARVSNGSEAAGHDLQKLFDETKRKVGVQDKKVQLAESLITGIGVRSQRRLKHAKSLDHILYGMKRGSLKDPADKLKSAEKELREVKAEMESQKYKLASAVKKVVGFEAADSKELQHFASVETMLASAKYEGDALDKKVVSVEDLMRLERNKVDKNAATVLSAENLFRDVKAADKLEAKTISVAAKFVKDLKNKGKKQAADLKKIEPLLSVNAEEGSKAAAKQAKKVKEAKESLDELTVELKADQSKPVSAEALLRGVIAGMESHMKQISAAIDSLGIDKDSEIKKIEELLRDLKFKSKKRSKNIAEAEKYVKTLVK